MKKDIVDKNLEKKYDNKIKRDYKDKSKRSKKNFLDTREVSDNPRYTQRMGAKR